MRLALQAGQEEVFDGVPKKWKKVQIDTLVRRAEDAAEMSANDEEIDENEFVEWRFEKFISVVVRWPENGPPTYQDVDFWVCWAGSPRSCATMEGALAFLGGGGTPTMVEEGKRLMVNAVFMSRAMGAMQHPTLSP